MAESKSGTVVESTGSRYLTRTPEGEIIEMRLRGKLRLLDSRATNPVAVGDQVSYEVTPEGEAVITEVETRRNYIIRKASNLSKESHVIAANLDQALIVASLSSPRTSTEFIDRFLVTCEAYDIPAGIILNKIDITTSTEELDEFIAIYETAGYPVYLISATEQIGIDKLRELTTGKVTLLTGNSGVGKSTIIKVLLPDADVKIGKISDYHHKGMHTTTLARMHLLPEGGSIIDTPGIKGFGLVNIGTNEVFRYFPEFMRHSPDCQYYNCTHTHEPGCAVVAAVENGEIAPQRYVSYLKLLDEDGKYRG